MGREGVEGKRVRVKRSREKGIGNNEKNRGREKEKGNQHGD